MGTVNAKAVVDMALSQVGKSCGKTNEYSKELDSVKFYNYPKNGAADSCSIFVDDMVFRCADPKDASYVRSVMYEPDKDNCGASCKFAVEYFKKNKAYITDPHAFQLGDKIFFKKKDGKLYHTGLIVGLGDKIETVEGNTNGGKVAKKSYSFNDEKIDGAGRPRYTSIEAPKEEPKPEEPIPEPTPDLKSIDEVAKEVIQGKWGNGEARKKNLEMAGYDYKEVQNRVNEMLKGSSSSSSGSKSNVYVVSTKSGLPLRLRSKPNTNSTRLESIKNGSEIKVSDIVKGESISGNTNWAQTTWNGKTGYCSMAHLKVK